MCVCACYQEEYAAVAGQFVEVFRDLFYPFPTLVSFLSGPTSTLREIKLKEDKKTTLIIFSK